LALTECDAAASGVLPIGGALLEVKRAALEKLRHPN